MLQDDAREGEKHRRMHIIKLTVGIHSFAESSKNRVCLINLHFEARICNYVLKFLISFECSSFSHKYRVD